MDDNLYVVGHFCAKLPQHCPRLSHGPGSVAAGLVPGRGQAQDVDRVAGAEGADDQIVHYLCILHHPQRDLAQGAAGGCASQQGLAVSP